MKCHELKDQLSLYVTGDLPARETAQITTHLDTCVECAEALKREEGTRNAFARLADGDHPEQLPSDFAMTVQRRVVTDQSRSWNPFRGLSITRLPMLVPAGAVVGLITILLFALSRAPQTGESLTDIHVNGQPLASIAALAEQHGGSIEGPFPVDSWTPSGQPGVFMLLHKPATERAAESFSLDYCGESGRLSSYAGSPWIRQRAGRLIARAGSRENVYIIVIVLPDSPNALRRRIEQDIRNDYQPFFNYRNGV